jgi:hypothetical protein
MTYKKLWLFFIQHTIQTSNQFEQISPNTERLHVNFTFVYFNERFNPNRNHLIHYPFGERSVNF